MNLSRLTILTLCFSCFAASNSFAQTIKNYDREWKKIDSLIGKKNLPQSALEEVKKIYATAKKENQNAQVIKALIYQISLQQQLRENNEDQSIKETEQEIAQSKQPEKAVLQNLSAGLYWQYFQQHRYQFYDRTSTVNFNKEDIATWTAEDFHKKISALYLQSINDEALLKQTELEPFDAIIIKGNTRYLRPTLYDLLAHEALKYFKNDERDIKKPAYAFEIAQPEAFAPATEFINYHFATKDSLSLQRKALLIYQQLIAFHLKDNKPEALLDVDLERLQFAYQYSVLTDKDTLYAAALQHIIAQYPHQPTMAQAQYLLAAYYESLASKYNPLTDTTYRYERIKAKNILERIVKDSTQKSEGWTNSYNLLNAINKKSFSFEVEKVNLPDQPFRALIQYKNVGLLNLRLIKADENLKKGFINLYNNQSWDALTKAAAVRSWQQSLPPTNDLQQHAVEIKIDALPPGDYILLAATDSAFNKKNNVLGAQLFYVSNISYVSQENRFFLLHRETGQPLANASVQLFQQVYNYKTYQYTKEKAGTYTSDKNGFFRIKKNRERGINYTVDITYKNDHLSNNEWMYTYQSNEEQEDNKENRIFFFTDRSIYRPGQTVYFKGIVVKKIKDATTIVTAYQTKIYLQNANSEEVDSVTLTTNDFGSFSGKFILPQNSLNGEFTIRDQEEENEISFSVEEYKRPKFYVDFDKVKESYKVNDSVAITGNAKAYAGNIIDGGKVSYRVVRQPRFIYSWYWRWPRTEPMEIAHGEATTDAAGQFVITFKAIPDLKIDKKTSPVFDYHIYADVTDINGETRSSDVIVSAGYQSLLLKIDMAERMPVDSLQSLFIRTENMNGNYQSSVVTVTIAPLIPEQRLIRKRYWQQPDQFVMNKEVYIASFPHDEYQNESDYHNWPQGAIVYTKSDSTTESGQWAIGNKQLAPGFYVITVTTKDKEGAEIKDVRYVELYRPDSKKLNRPEYLWTKESNTIEPGEKTNVQVGTASNNVFVIQQISKPDNGQPATNNFSFTQMSNEKKLFDFTATEKDRGNYSVAYFFVKDNRVYQFSDVIKVPWTNKELKIEYVTFRDKTLPGSREQWKVRLTGYKNEKAAAEMLASMYDASLDGFKMHSWEQPDIWPVTLGSLVWNEDQNFAAVQSYEKWIADYNYKGFDKRYDELNFFVQRGMNVRLRATASAVSKPAPMQDASKVVADSVSNELSGKASGVQAINPKNASLNEVVVVGYGVKRKDKVELSNPQDIQIRKNFNETAFFFPDLKTDSSGTIEFSFTAPEALTRWKLETFAHTKDLAFGLSQKEIVTQKELMVQPNMPRFLREGDRMELTAKIVNLSTKEFTGQAELQLFDAATNQSVSGWFQNIFPNQYFTVAAGQSEVVKFPVEVPYQFNKALVWRIVASTSAPAGKDREGVVSISDGEEAAMPVLTNKTLVTETMPLPMRGVGTKDFVFQKLLNSANSETLQNQALTVEYTSNPAWYAVQALPYLMEYPYECAEQTWNRYYANALASTIANASPRIKQIFEQWKTADTSALLSNLQKNEELKSVLLEEAPWVLQAKTEAEQKKNIALLFDLIRMSNELKTNLEKLKQMQSENGGFVWFKGGPDDRYITQYIITGIGHLKKLNGIIKDQQNSLNDILQTAIPYLDKKVKEDYDYLVKNKIDLKGQQISYLHIQYLYMRSFFPDYAVPQATQTAYNYYRQQAKKFWMKQNTYMQGMIALALNRTGDAQTPKDILKSLKETAIVNEELGMYWKNISFGYSPFWWSAPIETQSLLIEVFSEIGKDIKTTDNLKTWLIKNKQTNNWHTTKATADACYALLLQGANWLNNEPAVTIHLGGTTVSNTGQKTEAGTGYFKQTIDGSFIKPDMGHISVSVSSSNGGSREGSASWGAVYWQYFEDLDKITTAATPLQLSKKLFVEKNTDRGPVLTPVEQSTILHVGDKIKVRIELRVDRDLEYVHMKDMRAAALEPTNVLSGYQWQDALGYYQSTKDASTNFFFDYLRKGTYVFEYPMFVTNAGNFSNGITTIQCMYAPEFAAHSEGIRIKVEAPIP